MAATIQDLYLKYVNRVGKTLETDRYFQYLFEIIQASNNTISQQNQVLHKVVDERWLTTIEDTLDSINKIIEKPRRFITTNEEVVPVALAKKITADSVRHLSMNTQFIASSEDGNIQPTRVLNVSVEESYDLYENRFIYHLIQRLVTFIDKRTDIIFWSTGDEKRNSMVYESSIDDAYEQIEYRLEMKITNRQSFAENDTDNMSVFMRIDRVRRMVMALRNSSFCEIMKGCAKVRSPINRTNLMMKDPDYRNCYRLWQFLESYDEIGYEIQIENSTLEFDEEYMIQLMTSLITQYSLFKSVMEPDERNINKVLSKKRRVLKPKFIKKIQEEFVDDPNIEEVEIRRVFLEEVTERQLEAEAQLEEQKEENKRLQEVIEDSDIKMVVLQQQLMDLQQKVVDATRRGDDEEALRKQAQADLEATSEAYESISKTLETERQERESEITALNEAHQTRVNEITDHYEQQIATMDHLHEARTSDLEGRLAQLKLELDQNIDFQNNVFQQLANLTAQRDEALIAEEKAVMERDAALEREANTIESTNAHILEVETNAANEIQSIKDTSNAKIQSTNEKATKRIDEIQQQTNLMIQEMKESTQRELHQRSEMYREAYDESKKKMEQQLAVSAQENENRIAEITQRANQALVASKRNYEEQIVNLQNAIDQERNTNLELNEEIRQLQLRLQRETQLREKAEQRLENSGLRLFRRNRRKDDD